MQRPPFRLERRAWLLMSLVAERSATKDRNGTVPASAIKISRLQLHFARRPRSTAVISRSM